MNKEQFDNTLQRVNVLRSELKKSKGQSPLTIAEIVEYLEAIRALDAGLKDVYRDLPLESISTNGLEAYFTGGNVTINGIEDRIKKAHQAASEQYVIDKARLEAELSEKQAAFIENHNARNLKAKALTSLNQSSATDEAIQIVEQEMRNLAQISDKLNGDKSLAQDRIDQCEKEFEKVAGNFQSQLNSVPQLSVEHYAAQQAKLKAAGEALSTAYKMNEVFVKRVEVKSSNFREKFSSILQRASKPLQDKVKSSPLGRLLEDTGESQSEKRQLLDEKRQLLHALCIPTPGVETSKMVAAIPRKELESVYQNIIDAYQAQLSTVSTSVAAIEAKADLEKVIELLADREFSSIKRGHDNTISLGTNAKAKQLEAVTTLGEVVKDYEAKIAQLQEQEATEAAVAPTQVSSVPGWMSNPGLMTAGVVAIAAAVVAAYNAFSSPAEAASTVASSGLFSSVSNMTAEVAEAAANQVANIAPIAP